MKKLRYYALGLLLLAGSLSGQSPHLYDITDVRERRVIPE